MTRSTRSVIRLARHSRSPSVADRSMLKCQTLTTDDDQKRRGRLLLPRKGAPLATLLAHPLAAELDEYEQRWQCVGGAKHRCSFDVAGDPRRRPSASGSHGRRSRAGARMPSPLAPRAGARPAERASRRHTSDTLSMSKQVYGRATAPSDDHGSSAESQGFKPKSPSSHGALHGGNKAYHGSALPTELRGRGDAE